MKQHTTQNHSILNKWDKRLRALVCSLYHIIKCAQEIAEKPDYSRSQPKRQKIHGTVVNEIVVKWAVFG